MVDPATGETVYSCELAGTADVDAAVAAASEALPGWAGATPGARSDAMHRFAGVLAAQAAEFAYAESLQCGKPLRLTTEFDVPGTVDNTAFFAGAARHLEGKAAGEYSGDHTSYVRREPVGVVGSIAPWNYPLQMAAWKVLPAIAAGNTIVLKPAELTPLTSLMFAQAATEAGIPAGVVNIVTGAGQEAGEHLVGHPDVAMTSFTGSTAVGKRVAEIATATVKRLHLELGGKAPFVVFDDADLEAAVHGAVAGALINTGQDCTAATRAYVQRPSTTPSSPGSPTSSPASAWAIPSTPRPTSARSSPTPSATVSPPSWSAPAPTPRSSPAGTLHVGGRLLPAHAGHRRRAGQRDRPVRDLRAGTGRAAVRQR